jgi:hypothetical protein
MSTLKLNQIDFKKRKYKYSLYCSNCGKSNHLFSQCHNPITSYGICCFLNPSEFIDINNINNTYKTTYANITNNENKTYNKEWKYLDECLKDSIKYKDGKHRNNEYRLLMIQRQYSLAFMEFIRGKYDVENEEYIYSLFEKMTLQEINNICKTNDFIKIRKNMNFYNDINKKFKLELETAKLKFNYIIKLGILSNILNKINFIYGVNFQLGKAIVSPGIINYEEFFHNLQNKINIKITNENLNNKNYKIYNDTEWLIPKGKREDKETDLKTAIREFYEETGINTKYLHIYKNIVPIEITFVGINGIEYKNVYFIAELKSIPKSVKFCYNTNNNDIEINIMSKNKELKKELKKEVSNIKFLSINQCKEKCRYYENEQREFIGCLFNFYINFKKFFNSY